METDEEGEKRWEKKKKGGGSKYERDGQKENGGKWRREMRKHLCHRTHSGIKGLLASPEQRKTEIKPLFVPVWETGSGS